MTRIAVAWKGKRQVVSIDHMVATAKDRAFQRELNKAISLFSGHPIVNPEQWMMDNIMAAFGGGEVITPPKYAGAQADVVVIGK